jgi:hypothetical protein
MKRREWAIRETGRQQGNTLRGWQNRKREVVMRGMGYEGL